MRKVHILIYLTFCFFIFSCEDYTNPVEGIEETGLFVEFAAGTPETATLAEGDSITFTIVAPVSFEADLTATLQFEGTAVQGTDYRVSGDGLVSVSDSGAEVTIPFIPTNNSDVVPDQVEITITFLSDAVTEEEETLMVTLAGATGPDGVVLTGGRGPILKTTALTIQDTPLVFSFGPESVATIENNPDSTTFLLSFNFPVPQDFIVNLGTSGNLEEDNDVKLIDFSNSLTIPAGETEVSFKVANLDDNLLRNGADSLNIFIESYSFSGSGLSVEVPVDSVKYIIEDESKLLSVMVEGDTLMLDNASQDGFKTFGVMLENASSEDVMIGYTITPVNATPGLDYVDETNGVVKLRAGETMGEIVIQIMENAFSKTENVILKVELDAGSLVTSDQEVKLDEENKTFFIKVVNE